MNYIIGYIKLEQCDMQHEMNMDNDMCTSKTRGN